jgi:Putative transposase
VVEGFSLHADTAVHGNDRAGLGRLCRYAARGPVSESRLEKLEDGQYRYTPKKGPAFTVTAVALVKRLVALLPPPNRHLTSFHGVYAPNARLRPVVITKPAAAPAPSPAPTRPPQSAPRRERRHIDWATLHRRTFGTDVLQCPCGGRRKVTALHSTRRAAEERLTQLGVPHRSLLLPPQTAPPQLQLPV